MTDTLTRPAAEQLPEQSGPGGLTKKRSVILGLFIGVLVGLGLFAVVGGPSRAELADTRWAQVVDYYEGQYQAVTDARARSEAVYWSEVANHYSRQYELMRNAQSGPVSGSQAAHWEAVVDYYEQQWGTRAK